MEFKGKGSRENWKSKVTKGFGVALKKQLETPGEMENFSWGSRRSIAQL